MLLLPSTAALGAVLYRVIIVNIFLITVGVGFTGTSFITGPMELAAAGALAVFGRSRLALARANGWHGVPFLDS